MQRLLREPLFHFVIAAVILLAADAGWRHFRKPVVTISEAAVEARARNWEERTGRPPTGDQRMEIARQLATEEVLFRESLKREMASDNRVRDSLIQMMRTSLKPPVTPPSDEQLKEVRAASPKENIMLPAEVAFQHVSFLQRADIPDGLLEKLRRGETPPPSAPGIRLANPLPPTYRPQVEQVFGQAFTNAVFTLPPQEWQGPVQSSRGIHFVRVTSREAEKPIPFA
ncbi:MAG: peptidyl-prolyl cis-trans isomerase, partial [Verrucomicrobiaceae bacterium]